MESQPQNPEFRINPFAHVNSACCSNTNDSVKKEETLKILSLAPPWGKSV